MQEIKRLKEENEQENIKRLNLLEYEKLAKEINSLPKKDASLNEISRIENEITFIRNRRKEKEMHIDQIEISGQEVIRRIKEMIKNAEDLVNS